MENQIPVEPELGKHEDSDTETPPMQQPEPEAPEKTKTATDPIKKLQDELAEAKDKYVRLYAEFENHRRRTAKEKLEMVVGANENLLKALLPVVDDFDRAAKAFKDNTSKEAEGFFLIQNKFSKILEMYGVKAMDTTPGTAFNPDFHEAITQVPVEDGKLKGKIVEAVEKGFLLNDKVIRFAKVVIGS